MFYVCNNQITMIRGDTLRLSLIIKDSEGKLYTPDEGDVIRFAAKYSFDDKNIIISKNILNDTLELVLDPNDTKLLKQPSSLVYDIQITHTDGTVDTFLYGTLLIKHEVD